MRELGEKQSLCQLPRSISWRDSQLVYLPSLLQKAWYLIPNAPINHMCFGLLFQFIRNPVPVELEHCSNLAGTRVQLSCTNAGA